MIGALFFGALIALQGGRAAAPPPNGADAARPAEAADWRVVVAAPVYQPNGAVSAETAAISSVDPGVVHVYSRRTLCDTATTGGAEPRDAGFGWRLATHTVSRSSSEIIVSVEWRRVWDRGQKLASGPAGTVQLTLHPGDRIPLDLIPNVVATDACRAVGMGLEILLARAATVAPPGPGSVVLPLGAVEGGAKALDAELWLLHTLPSGVQQVQHQTVRLPVAGSTFSFTPVKLTTPRGEIDVELTGSIQRYRAPTAGEFLLVSMARVIKGGAAPRGGLGGTTPGTLIALPGPAEVLSFEMPGDGGFARRGGGGGGGGVAMGAGAVAGAMVRQAGGGGSGGGAATGGAGGRGGSISAGPAMSQAVALLDGHGFSIRVRVTPAAGS